MNASAADAKREHRISMEIVVDAYTEEECAMAWSCHLEDQLSFPFKARVRQTMSACGRFLKDLPDYFGPKFDWDR
ncbi:hypothetical protein WL29_10980 [Burkholderia ubonensis]|uniref:Uncharacterized protein n=1 Tax=Burkholderia ubonensis TaxID=101571 RepID=A0A106UI16_9BURK|nr:calcium-binding protein [Burkholderia ubonensis]KWA86272.1 hypothetical protein WL29_10980 [Burkholderia ubonensis]KWB91754.1 hypothetical protein WL43_03410 [Burkholderia ubonensis]